MQIIRILLISVVLLISILCCRTAAAQTIVHADEIVEKVVRNEPVIYHDVIIIGDLDFRSANWDTYPKSIDDNIFIGEDYTTTRKFVDVPMYIVNSTFKGHVDFSHMIFNRSTAFTASRFENGVDFGDS